MLKHYKNLRSYLSDVLIFNYISGMVITGMSFGYHNITNANLYLKCTSKSESKIGDKRLLHCVSIAKASIYSLVWPIFLTAQYFRNNPLPMVCPMYKITKYRKFYIENKHRMSIMS